MADTKISALTAEASPAGTDVVPVVSGGATKKVTINDLVSAGGAGSQVYPITIQLTSADTSTDFNTTGWVAVPWDTTPTDSQLNIKDTGFTHSTATNPSRITVDAAGVYLLNCTVVYDCDTSIRQSLQGAVRLNGTTTLAARWWGTYMRAATAGDDDRGGLVMTAVLDLAASDYVEIMVQEGATTGVTNLVSGASLFSLTKIA